MAEPKMEVIKTQSKGTKEKVVEIATYIIVPSVMIVVSPLLGKYLDLLILKTDYVFAQSTILIFTGTLISLMGVLLALWTIFLFKKYGKGTPNPTIPPKELVIRGPYKLIRNPMVLGGALVLFGEVILYYSLFLLVISIFYLIITYLNAMFIEEPELKKRFGHPYEEYLKKVPRLFPKIFKLRINI
jgi:protein-S-isoprenylcysteine O-methyltransferase Ste14